MPNSARLTLLEIRNQIKIESRVKGADNLDAAIDLIVNQLLLEYAQKNRYFEFLVTNSPITTSLSTGSYDLPEDYMNMRLVRYRQTPTLYTRTLHPRSGFINTASGRHPRYYEVVGNQIEVFPFDDLPANDVVLLDYYKIPETLVAADPFPIPRLLPTLLRDAIHRVLLYNRDLATAAAHMGEAVTVEARSRPADG